MPDSPDSTPIGRLIARLIRREHISNSLADEARKREVDLFREIEALFRRIDPTDVQRTRYRRGRTQKFLRELERMLREHEPEMAAWLKDRLAPIGRAEALAAQTELVASLGAVGEEVVNRTPITQQRLRAILNTDPFRGRTLKEHARRHSRNTLDRVRTQVRIGMVQEEAIPDIVRRIRGHRVRGAASGFRGGVLQTNTREAEALVRTAVTHVSTEGMLETFRANETVVKGVEFVAVIDDRTTVVCAAWDGTVWPPDSSDIQRPPLHWNCRSTLVPAVDWEGLGLDPPPEPDRVFRDMSSVDDAQLRRKVSARRRAGRKGETRKDTLGEVRKMPSSVSMEDWLKRQRRPVVNRVLGKERADAFLSGEISSLKQLLDSDNSLIPLDRLLEN